MMPSRGVKVSTGVALFSLSLFVGSFLTTRPVGAATAQELRLQIDSRTTEIKRLEAEIAGYQSQLTATSKVASSLQGEIIRLETTRKKLAAGKRMSYKDYVDWYFLLKERHVELTDVMALAKRKFENDFNDRLFLGQLVSLSEVPTQKIDFLRDEVDRETITKFLESTVKEFKI